MTVDKAALLAGQLPEAWVELPGVGDVRVRGLTRAEAVRVADIDSTAKRERLIITYGMVEPALTPDEVTRWYDQGDAGSIQRIVEAIARLSGLLPDSPKSGHAGDLDGQRSDVRALPGGETGPDGGGAAGDVQQ